MNFILTEDNFLLYAIKHYDNPHCKGMSEFNDDLKRFRYIKRLFRKYTAGKGLKERLIINHIVVLYNLFGPEAATKMLFFKVERKYWAQLKTFLVFLNLMPSVIVNSEDCTINESEIEIDLTVADTLRKI